MDEDDAQYLKNLRDDTARTREFFSPAMKSERERAVCRAFLRCLGIEFKDVEIIASKAEPVDVEFRTAKFQIRESIDPGRKRGDELKATQRKYENATSIDELSTPYKPSRPRSLEQLVTRVTEDLQEKRAKYGKGCQDLDALVYVDLHDQHLNVNSDFPDLASLKAQGWRSVSVIFAPCSLVLFANPGGPDFLLKHAGQIQKRSDRWDTLFEVESDGQ